MSKRWIQAKRDEFARDVMRDFCMVCDILDDQFIRFDENGIVSFAVIRDLLGNLMNKGLLWRLKDTAHHLFRSDTDNPTVGRMLDWSVGYIFHETIKLKEDAYQHQHYAPLYLALNEQIRSKELKSISEPLCEVLDQTDESTAREITRIRYVIEQAQKMMCLYYTRHNENRLLARLLYDKRELVEHVFLDVYEDLISSIYGNAPEKMYIQAAESLLEGGRAEEALQAAEEAVRLAPGSKKAITTRDHAEKFFQQSSPRRAISHDTAAS